MLTATQQERPAEAAAAASSTQVWFGPTDRPLHGWLHLPADGTVRGAVLLCNSIGEEGAAAHRSLRLLGELLAGHGLAALRFDYDGTGDSAGELIDPERVEAWLASIDHAASYVRGLGAPSVAVAGIRIGATLAATAAARTPGGFRDLVLWDPCRSGRSFLRENEAVLALSGVAVPDDPGFRHTPGFQYDHPTAAGLARLRFDDLPDGPPADGVLLVRREDRPVADEILRRAAAEQWTVLPAEGQSALLDVRAHERVTPRATVTAIASWLADRHRDASPASMTVPADGSALIHEGDRLVRETSTRVAGLSAVRSEPAAGADPDRPWVVLLSGSVNAHRGPGRCWVEYARRWAADGHRVLRLDMSGGGDSPTRPGQVEDLIYAPEWIEDGRRLVAELAADGSRVLLIGLCSGAYSALETAAWEHVDAVLAVNPVLTLTPAAPGTPAHTPVRRAAIVPPVASTQMTHARRKGIWGLWRYARQLAFWMAPARALRRVVVRTAGVVWVVAGTRDAADLTEVRVWRPVIARLRRRPDFRLVEDADLDHALITRPAQQALFRHATAFLEHVSRDGAVGVGEADETGGAP